MNSPNFFMPAATVKIDDDCKLQELAGTVCTNFNDPEAAFVVFNYVNYHQGSHNHHLAIRQAAGSILNSGFIDTMANALVPESESIGPAVLKLLSGLAAGKLTFSLENCVVFEGAIV